MDNKTNHLDRVIELLKEGTDCKKLHSETQQAENALQKASDIVDEHRLPDPWPQLVRYRLAHVLFRRAKTKDEFLEIDSLLQTAAQANCLGPLPRLYRLAAMFQCGLKPNQMKVVFNTLLEEIDHYADYDTENEEDDNGNNRDRAKKADRFDHLTALQNNFFNMLELAAYFTGYPYEGFEGKGLSKLAMNRGPLEDRNPYSDLFSSMMEWRLVGTIPGLASTAYPREIALAELESRMERGEIQPPCVAFRISADKSTHEWNFNLQKDGNKFVWERLSRNTNHLLFLAAIFQFRGCRSRHDLLDNMFMGDQEDDNMKFRTWKKRCKKALIEGFKEADTKNISIDLKTILLDDTRADRPVPEFHPSISVIGAMDVSLSYE